MARVFGRRPASALARRAPSRAVQRRSRKHKVVMESVTQEKKKLRSVISFEANAPAGYTFIPAGNPQLTTASRDVLKDLFPNIPDNDLNQIIKTAFQKGQRKVGTAVELPLARRAQLAVVAHIRHIYTDYDRLLKATSFHEARSTVEEPTLAKLVEWRGDDENGKTVLEDVFREVIVISDDEDTDTDEGDIPQTDDRDLSVEIVASNARAEELQTRPLNFANSSVRESLRDLSEDEAPLGFRIIPEPPKKNKIDRRGFSRYQAWDRFVTAHLTFGDPFTPYDNPLKRVPELKENLLGAEFWPLATSPLHHLLFPIKDMLKLYELPPFTESSRQRNFQLAPLPEVIPLERAPIPKENIPSQQADSPNAPVFVSGPRALREKDEGQFRHHSRASVSLHNIASLDFQDRALPSIEIPSSPLEIRRPDSGRLDHLAKKMSGDFTIRSVTPHHLLQDIPPNGVEDNTRNQAPKRRRMAYYDPVHYESRFNTAPGAIKPVTPITHKDAYTGERHIPFEYASSGQLTAQNDPHIRREHLAPVDLPRFIGRHPDRVQDSFFFPSSSHVNPEILVGPRHFDDPRYETGLYTRPRSPQQKQSHTFSNTSYAVPTGDGTGRTAPVCSADPRPHRVYNEDRNFNIDGLRPVEAPEPHITALRNNTSDCLLVPREAPQRRQIYADDFVRPVDLHEPGPLEYTMQRPRLRTSRVAETVPQPPNLRVYNDHNRELPSSMVSKVHPNRSRLDSRVVQSGLEYPEATHRGSKIFDYSSAARHDERLYEGPLDSARQIYERQHPGPEMEQHQPVYVRRVERSAPHIPEGRAIVIVD
ncbi:hypothetical protein MW887_001725 [Aspergillus wentii]|nr:hypothetical protein MW887_001725 [Aspergillus wentii]